jgi:Mn2+/Fe2+ NRAMP family transporter
MVAIQEISARIGRTTGRGIATNIRRHYPDWMLQGIVVLVLVANIINIGADIGAMGDAVKELVGGPHLLYVVAIAALCALLEIFVSYQRYARILRWLTLALFSYFATVAVVHVPWGEAARGFFVPTFSADPAFWTTVVAILGTTISPYLFFWQASQEVEDVRADPGAQALVRAPRQAPREFERIRLDTAVGMAFSNLVALAIIITTAATLHVHGITEIETSAQAASALRPLAGEFAFVIFALGIIGTGLLAVPVLAGSAAYALAEARKWPEGLARKPHKAKAFYATIAAATLIGVLINFSPVSPIKALYWSAVINGVAAVPIMTMMMHMTANKRVMGDFPVSDGLRIVGWCATAVMAAAVAGMLVGIGR